MRAYFDDLAWGLGWRSEERLAMTEMRWHYLDESGDHARDGSLRRLVLGGCVATTEAWKEFCAAWEKMLLEFEIPEFHMVDIQGWQPPFDFKLPNGDRDKDKHNRLIDRAVDIVIEHVHEIIGFVSDPEPGKDPFDSAYDSNVAKAIKEAAKDYWASELPLTMVFAKHADFSAARIGAYFDLWKADHPGLQFGGVGSPNCVLPLQAADLTAYEMCRYVREVQPDSVRYPMVRLAEAFKEKQKLHSGRFVVIWVPSGKRK